MPPLVIAAPASTPTQTLKFDDVIAPPALYPIAIFPSPVVIAFKAVAPTATFFVAVLSVDVGSCPIYIESSAISTSDKSFKLAVSQVGTAPSPAERKYCPDVPGVLAPKFKSPVIVKLVTVATAGVSPPITTPSISPPAIKTLEVGSASVPNVSMYAIPSI